MLPFTLDQFMSVFMAYNDAIWPMQIVAYVVGAGAVMLLFRPGPVASRLIAGAVALMWLWTGIAYHWLNFATINPGAYLFGAFCVLQGLLFFYFGVMRDHLRFGYEGGVAAIVGSLLILYAGVLYPLIGVWTGHAYPALPMFGVTPCPVTIFTFGLLLLTTASVSRWLLVIPFLWSLVGGSAAFLLGIPQDWLLLVSGLIAVPMIVMHDRRGHAPPAFA